MKMLKSIILLMVLVMVAVFMPSVASAQAGSLFWATDMSTASVAGASGAAISTYTFNTTGTNIGKSGNIAIEKIVLANGTTGAFLIQIYEYITLGSTNTIAGVVGASLAAGDSIDIDWPFTNREYVTNILMRKIPAFTGFAEGGQIGEVTGYVLYR